MNIGSRQIGPTHPPYIIAEIGVNHDGDVNRAIELVKVAAQVKADAIKLQLFEADRLLGRAARLAAYQERSGAADPFAMLRNLELRIDEMEPIVRAAHDANLHAIVTVFSVELVSQAAALDWDAFKTASPDIINQPLLQTLAAANRPLLVSTGASTMQEVLRATQWLGHCPHLLMQCVSAYPTPDESASLNGIRALQQATLQPAGYSDHTTSIDTGGLAVACGACVLEKHLTYDRLAIGPDHAASLNPDEFAEYVRLAHRAHSMLGSLTKEALPIEHDVRTVSRQSLTSTRPLHAGHMLTHADVTIKRPGTGLPPCNLQSILGRRLARDIDGDVPLQEMDLA